MTGQAAPNAAQPQGMGALQNFMANLGQQPQGGGFAPTYTRPPAPTNPFIAPSHLAANDFGPFGPEHVRNMGDMGLPSSGWQGQGMTDAVAMGANPANLEGYGRFRSNSPQNGYPTWNAPFQTTPHTPLQGAIPSAETVQGWGGKFAQPQGGGFGGFLGGFADMFGGLSNGGGGGKPNSNEIATIVANKL